MLSTKNSKCLRKSWKELYSAQRHAASHRWPRVVSVCKPWPSAYIPSRRKILQNILLYTAGQSCFPHNPLLDRNCRKDGMTYCFSPPHHVHASLPTAPSSTNTSHRLNQQTAELTYRFRVPGQPHPNFYQASSKGRPS